MIQRCQPRHRHGAHDKSLRQIFFTREMMVEGSRGDADHCYDIVNPGRLDPCTANSLLASPMICVRRTAEER